MADFAKREKDLFHFLGKLIDDLEKEGIKTEERHECSSLITGEIFVSTPFGEFLALCHALKDKTLAGVLYAGRIFNREDIERTEGGRKTADVIDELKKDLGAIDDTNVENMEMLYDWAAKDITEGGAISRCVSELEYFMEKKPDFLPPYLSYRKEGIVYMIDSMILPRAIRERIEERKMQKINCKQE